MHLIVLENEPSANRGGQEISLFDVCCALQQRGHQITLLYTKPGNLLAAYKASGAQTVRVGCYRFRRDQLGCWLRSFYQATSQIKINSSSLIYGNQHQDSLFGHGLATYWRLPFVCHLRQPPNTIGLQSTWGLRGATRLITISEHTKVDWVKAGFAADKLAVTYNGIDVDRFQPAADWVAAKRQLELSPDLPTIGYAGRLDKVKGIETLLQAIAQLSQQRPVQVIIAGQAVIQAADYQASLQQLARQLGIQQHVKFLGYVSDVTTVYQASDVTVLPSVWHEPFGRTLLESMACGVPIVASRVGGIPEVLTGEFAQNLFAARDAVGLAARLSDLLDWRQQDPGLGQRCRQHVATQFPLEKAVDGIERILQTALHQRRPPKSAQPAFDLK